MDPVQRPLSILVRALLSALALVAVVTAMFVAVSGAEAPPPEVEIVLFWLDGCPYCEAERAFLAEFTAEEPAVRATAYELSSSAEGRNLLAAEGARLGFEITGVPVTVLGDRFWIGFDEDTELEIRDEVARLLTPPTSEPTPSPQPTAPPIGPAVPDVVEERTAVEEPAVVDVPLVGDVEVEGRSLAVATVLIALVDGVNPCSLWVLSVLLALVLHSGSRRRVLAVGGAFLVTTTAMYGLYIVGAYGVLSYVRYLGWIERGVAAVALLAGVLVIKDGLGIQAGPSLAIADAHKPGLYQRMRALAAPERSLASALGATILLGVGVSLIETPCSAALPILWTDLLAANDVGLTAASGLFALYMLVFLLDELVVFAAAVVTMRALKIQQRHGQTLQLVSGSVLVVLAGTMLLDPGLLTELGGVLAVATASAGLTLVLQRIARHPHPAPRSRSMSSSGRAS